MNNRRVQSNSISQREIAVALFVLAVVIMSSIGLLWLYNIMTQPSITPVDKFCQADDPVYQEIVANTSGWMTQWKSLSPASDETYPEMMLTFGDGQEHAVRPYYSRESNTPEFYVITKTDWPWTQPYGIQGYWYSPANDLSESNRMRYENLEGDVYCYWYK